MHSPAWGNGKEAAQHLGMTQTTFYKLVQKGVIKGYKPSGAKTTRYNFAELDLAMRDNDGDAT